VALETRAPEELRRGLDLSFAWLGARAPASLPLGLVVESEAALREVLPRLDRRVMLLATPAQLANGLGAVLKESWPLRSAPTEHAGPGASREDDGLLGAALAIAPSAGSLGRLTQAAACLTEGGWIACLAPDRLDAWLRPLRRATVVRPDALAAELLEGELEKLGLVVEARARIGSRRSVLTGGCARLAGLLGRPDLADRAEAAYRLSLEPALVAPRSGPGLLRLTLARPSVGSSKSASDTAG
jgi:hypothetical protein